MTLVSIMKDEDNPRVKIAAARALLARGAEAAPLEQELTGDDIDAAIAIAKELLDELAIRKAGGVPGAGEVDIEGAARPDHPAG